MYWLQKGQLTCQNTQRRDQLSQQITNYLVDKNTRRVLVVNGTSVELIFRVEYSAQVDADTVWQDLMTADVSGWIVSPSFAGYGQFPETVDDGEFVLLGRRDW